MSKGAMLAGVNAGRIHRIVDEGEAVDACLRMGTPGDLIVLMPTAVEKVWRQILAFRPDPAGATITESAHA